MGMNTQLGGQKTGLLMVKYQPFTASTELVPEAAPSPIQSTIQIIGRTQFIANLDYFFAPSDATQTRQLNLQGF